MDTSLIIQNYNIATKIVAIVAGICGVIGMYWVLTALPKLAPGRSAGARITPTNVMVAFVVAGLLLQFSWYQNTMAATVYENPLAYGEMMPPGRSAGVALVVLYLSVVGQLAMLYGLWLWFRSQNPNLAYMQITGGKVLTFTIGGLALWQIERTGAFVLGFFKPVLPMI